MKILNRLRQLAEKIDLIHSKSSGAEDAMLISGRILCEMSKSKQKIESFEDVEFSVFSQFGDDGIIQWLINNINIENKSFVEFGVEDYRESNTRFLMMNNNWSGLVMDGSEDNIAKIINSEYYWKHDLQAKPAFIDVNNVNSLIKTSDFGKDIGILHIDLDGNDYWIWEAIDCISPDVVILEYNSVFGVDREITVPYRKDFNRTKAHCSNLYFGASLAALSTLSSKKGYSLVGCNSAGNNAYFVRNDKLNSIVQAQTVDRAYVASKFRESRDEKGRLTYARAQQRAQIIKGMPVYNCSTDKIEEF